MAIEAERRPDGNVVAAAGTPADLTVVERILNRLGSPRWLWILAWGLVPFASLAVILALAGVTGGQVKPTAFFDRAVPEGILAYFVVLTLWGLDRLMPRIRALEPRLTDLGGAGTSVDRLPLGNPVIPLVLAASLTAIDSADALPRYGALSTVVDLPLAFVTHLPIASFAWAYVAFLIGLDRLGRHPLALDVFPQDRSLGLGPMGSVAFTGFGIVVAGVLPLLVANATNLGGAIESTAGIAVAVLAFFLSMWRLHRQMSDAKARYVAVARDLYAEAYEPVRAQGTLRALQAQAGAIRAAQALEQRAQSIYEWPIDERTSARIAIILTGVITGLIVRVVTAGLHL